MNIPFETYPDRGRCLLGKRTTGNCRHDYGLKFAKLTGQTRCGYCDRDLIASYEVWLTMSLDHAVPKNLARKLQIPNEWVQDYANGILTCSACNGFDNRYEPSFKVESPATPEEFFALRDRIFIERKKRIQACHDQEKVFFEKHWKTLNS